MMVFLTGLMALIWWLVLHIPHGLILIGVPLGFGYAVDRWWTRYIADSFFDFFTRWVRGVVVGIVLFLAWIFIMWLGCENLKGCTHEFWY